MKNRTRYFSKNSCCYQDSPANAKVSTLIRNPGMPRKASAQETTVAPVVSTSSTNKRCFPSKLPGKIQANKFRTFSHLAYCPLCVCVSVYLLLITTLVSIGIPVTTETPLARHSLWLYPLKRFYVDVTEQEQSNLSHQKMRTHKFRCHHPPHHFTHFLITMIFQFVQQLSDISSLCIIKKRGGMLHRYFSPEITFYNIIFP